MSVHKQAVNSAREAWIAAYLAGDCQRLQHFEGQALHIISDRGVEDLTTRYQAIESKKRSGQWFKSSVTMVELERSITEYQGVISVVSHTQLVGKGRVIRESWASEPEGSPQLA